MKKRLAWILSTLLILGISFSAAPFIWTSFWKTGNPITLPSTTFISGWVQSWNYVSWGTTLMTIQQSGVNVYVPLLDWSGNAYSTGWGTNYWSTSWANIYNNNTGGVGIGISTPITQFQVFGSLAWITLSRTSWSEPFILLQWWTGYTDLAQIRWLSGGGLRITNGSSSTERMRLSSSGNVWIWTTGPTQALDVSWSVNAKRIILPDTEASGNAGYFSNTSPASFGWPIIQFAPMSNNKYTQFVIASSWTASTPAQAGLGASDNVATFEMQVERVDAWGQAVGTITTPTIATIGTAYPIRFWNRASNSAFTEYMRITTGGKIGIGTPTPSALMYLSWSYASMIVDANTSTNSFVEWDIGWVPKTYFGTVWVAWGFIANTTVGSMALRTTWSGGIYMSTDNGATAMAVLTTGWSLWIWTATPFAYAGTRLHTNVDGANLNLNLSTQYSTDWTNYPQYYMAKGRGTQASPLVAQTGDILWAYSFAAQYDTTLNHVTRTAYMQGSLEWTCSATNCPTGIWWAVTPVSTASPVIKMTLNNAGNFGIGITIPTALLHLTWWTTTNAPFKLTAWTNLTTPQVGAIEYDGTKLYMTMAAAVRQEFNTVSFGNIWVDNDVSPVNITVTTGWTFYPWIGWAISYTGWYLSASGTNSSFTVLTWWDWYYKVAWSLSFGWTVNSVVHCWVWTWAATVQWQTEAQRKLNASWDVWSMAWDGVIRTSIWETYQLFCTSDGNGNVVSVNHATFTLNKIWR